MRPAAFLDRDGVLNVDHGYVVRPEDWEWTHEAPESIRWLNDRGYAVVVVTNQSGIGRGFYAEEDLEQLHYHVQLELGRIGAHVDAFYHCPHLPEDGCNCRKPLPGMIERAIEDLDLDRSRSFLVGDRESDLQAASAAGIPAYLYEGGSLLEFLRSKGNLLP